MAWCWTETKWVCRDSADANILSKAVNTYKNPAVYQYGNYSFPFPTSLKESWMWGIWPDGTRDICNADGTYNPSGDGKFEISCWFVVSNTLNSLGYHSWPNNFVKPDYYFCPVDWTDVHPGDIFFMYNSASKNPNSLTHVAIVANEPFETLYGVYTIKMFGAQNFRTGIDYLSFDVQAKSGLVFSTINPTLLSTWKVEIWRPKVKVIELKCKEPDRPPDHALYQYHGDPLMLDLDGGGIQTVGLDAGVHFDHDGNGFKELTGWVTPGDGVLMLDKNGNGLLDDGSELFGDSTILPDGTKASNGFQALAHYDVNHDGKIDANDPIWQQLRIWQPDTYVLPQGYG